jgi:Fic family protein
LRHQYELIEYLSISQKVLLGPSQYARAYLYTETDDNDATYFILYHLSIIIKAYDSLRAAVRDKARAIRKLERLTFSSRLNSRQKELISHALRNPGFKYTIKSHRTYHNIVSETSRLDLVGLVELGLLTDVKEGRTRVFRPVDELHERVVALN